MEKSKGNRNIELVVLAAGLSSRFGAPKQLEPMDGFGNTIIDFSLYDALEVGFSSITFVVREEMKSALENKFQHLKEKAEIKFAIQQVNDDRKKPWGTGHALLSCRNLISNPFAVINCDDYYGRKTMKKLFDFLSKENQSWALMGYLLEKTLPKSGGVARAVCKTSADNFLSEVCEQKNIVRGKTACSSLDNGEILSNDTLVSMNMWGFTPKIFPLLDLFFNEFIKTTQDPLSDEFYLPTAINRAISKGHSVRVLQAEDDWIGITHREDKAEAVKKFAELKRQGLFPTELWD